MVRQSKRLIGAVAILVLLGASTAYAAVDAKSYFAAGLQAFRAGNYQQARDQFARARRAGMRGAVVDYNLGVSHYKLGEYRDAKRAFLRVTEHPPMAPLAYYNLGLVAVKLNDPDEAWRSFQQARAASDDARLQALANEQLDRLRPIRPRPADEWIVSLSTAAGSDDNLIEPTLETATTESDTFVELFAMASGPLTGSTLDGVQLALSAYLVRYQDLDDYDMNVLHAELLKLRPLGSWQTELGGRFEQSTLGSNDYLRTLGLVVGGRRPVNEALEFRVRYLFDNLDALDNAYDPLQGTRHRFRTEARWRSPVRRVRLAYELELNDRDDLRDGTLFSSYSPTRHTARIVTDRRISARWNVEGELQYRKSKYNDANVLTDGTQVRRDDDRYQAGIRLARSLDLDWQIYAEYRYTDNVSNITVYDYERNLFMAGLMGVF